MIIYKITNIIRNKCYIGQTVGTFKTRYRGGKWWKYTDNILLQNAYAKYGPTAFEVEILEKDIPSIDELNRLEIFYAEKFNAYNPHGYNLRGCGDNRFMLPEQIEEMRLRSCKTYYVRKISTWEVVEITDLVRFCKENKLSYHSMYSLIKGGRDVLTTGGYCSISTSLNRIENKQQVKFKNDPISLINPHGELIYIENPREFAEINNLGKGSFYKMLHGEILYYKGYRLPSNVGKVAKNIKKFKLCHNFGEPNEFVNVSKFCKGRGLSLNSITKVLDGSMKSHGGWHLPSLTKEELFMRKKRGKISVNLLDPDGRLVLISNLAFFCQINNLPYASFYSLIKKQSASCLGWTIEENHHLFNTFISPEGIFYKSIGNSRICQAFDLDPHCIGNIQNPNTKSNFHKGWTSFRNGQKAKVDVILGEQGFLEKYDLP